jgi:phosphohistidine phosphatase SixA
MQSTVVLFARFLMLLAGVAASLIAVASEVDPRSLLPSLQKGGYVIVMRHGPTSQTQKDVYPFDFTDMSKQRQLSAEGREQAVQTGKSFRALGIPIGRVYSSRLNRAVETASLIAGKSAITSDDLIDSGAGSASAMASPSATGATRYGEALRQLVTAEPDAHTNTLIVTHKTNIQDGFAEQGSDVGEGDSLVFRPDGSTHPILVAKVRASDWSKMIPPR